MTAARKLGFQPDLHDHAGQLAANHARAQGEHIRVVVLAAHLRGEAVGADHAADALHLVGRQGDADARAAAQDAALALAAGDSVGRLLAEDGVVAALTGIGALVLIFEVLAVEQLHDFLLERESRVVASQCNHGFSSCDIKNHCRDVHCASVLLILIRS